MTCTPTRDMNPVKATLVAMLAAPLALSLAGCGFTPLYADQGLSSALAGVQVAAPDTRVGYLLREKLDDELAHRSGAAPFRLDIKLVQTRIPRGVRQNNVASLYEMDLAAPYTLIETTSGRAVYQGRASVIVSYDSVDSPYGGVAAEKDAEERAAQQAAIQIRLQLSRFLAGRPSASGLAPTPVPNDPVNP